VPAERTVTVFGKIGPILVPEGAGHTYVGFGFQFFNPISQFGELPLVSFEYRSRVVTSLHNFLLEAV
jgi:hypothetical protein